MNQPMVDHDIDDMMRAMAQAKRRRLLIGAGIVCAIPVLAGLYVAQGILAARAALEKDGYTEVKVRVVGPISYGFQARKGNSECSGTYTRTPISSSAREICFDSPKAAAEPPATPNRERIEPSLEKKYGQFGFTQADCPEIRGAQESATCTLRAKNGTSLGVLVKPTAVDAKGGWTTWEMTPQANSYDGEQLAAKLAREVSEARAKKGNRELLSVDCGTGPQVPVAGKLVCQVATPDQKKSGGTITLTFGQQRDTYTWELDPPRREPTRTK